MRAQPLLGSSAKRTVLESPGVRSEVAVLGDAAQGPEGVTRECPMMVTHLWVLQADTQMAITVLS